MGGPTRKGSNIIGPPLTPSRSGLTPLRHGGYNKSDLLTEVILNIVLSVSNRWERASNTSADSQKGFHGLISQPSPSADGRGLPAEGRLGRDIAPIFYQSFSFRLADADKISNKHEESVK